MLPSRWLAAPAALRRLDLSAGGRKLDRILIPGPNRGASTAGSTPVESVRPIYPGLQTPLASVSMPTISPPSASTRTVNHYFQPVNYCCGQSHLRASVLIARKQPSGALKPDLKDYNCERVVGASSEP